MGGTAGILHISDLHFGMSAQRTLLQAFKRALIDDLKRMAEHAGPIELVVFSGDLVQKGLAAEYSALNSFLEELWEVLERTGANPSLFCVPGNHDLVRPTPGAVITKAMEHWWDGEVMSPYLFEHDAGYLAVVQEAFQNYSNWMKHASVPVLDTVAGYLPGDSMGTFTSVDGLRVGLVGLNSAWLQLREGNLKGQLHVDPSQLMSLCQEPDTWSEGHDATLIVTHHPVDWLHESSQEAWRSEINTHQRFDFHMFGHMHDQQLTSIQHGGSVAKRSMQAASLFGLEKAAGGRVDRQHGYSVLKLNSDQDRSELLLYPRKGIVIKGSREHRLAPDVELGLDDRNALVVPFRSRLTRSDDSAGASLDQQLINRVGEDSLLGLRRSLPESGAWRRVRKWEREIAVAALTQRALLWVTADWGMGFEAFLESLFEPGFSSGAFYQIELDSSATREQILASIEERYANSVEGICLALSSVGSGFLVIEDEGSGDVGADALVDILRAISDYCPDLSIIVKSRFKCRGGGFAEVALKPLDDVDSASFIRAWAGGRHAGLGEDEISSIIRHSGGVPVRLESIVEDFEMFGSSELGGLNPDLDASLGATPGRISPIISREIHRLRTDPDAKKLMSLLRVLAMFPRGETFEVVKRLHGPVGFHPQEARELKRLALLDSVEVASLTGRSEMVLMVPVPVREALFQVLKDKEFTALSVRALELYFGSDWKSKGLKSAKVKFHDSSCENWKIANASAMVHRVVRASLASGSERDIAGSLQLSYMYAKALENGDHFRSCAEFAADVTPILREAARVGGCDELALLLCKALRMSGRHQESLVQMEAIDLDRLSSTSKQGYHYSRAESLRQLHREDEAADEAKLCIEVNKKSGTAIQAKALLVDMKGGEGSELKLAELERSARKNKHSVAASNIAISRSYDMDDDEAIRTLRGVQQEAKVSGDAYNCVRASVRLARLLIDSGEAVDSITYRVLLDGYHMLHADGANVLFDRITDVLWDIFALRGELMNQISLFRHSSLRWRLRDDPAAERKYIDFMPAVVDRLRIQGMHERFEVVYVMSRI